MNLLLITVLGGIAFAAALAYGLSDKLFSANKPKDGIRATTTRELPVRR
jgi:hypothetical protein